jgi:hypothetical protein
MGKRIEDLPVDDTPLGDHRHATPPATTDPRGTAWYRFLTDIEDLLATGQYTWAENTLRSIQTTVEQTQRVTSGQQAAVDNISRAKTRGRRRYEGFPGSDR